MPPGKEAWHEIMTDEKKRSLESTALRVREHIIRMATNGGCFIGASMSCADLLVYLYGEYLRISPAFVRARERDYLLLSKGHDVPALYGTLAEFGFLEKERLAHHLTVHDNIYWHPHVSIPGVEFHSGSLGHLLSVGMGIALDSAVEGYSNKVIVVLGDGELNEGSVWEAILVAASRKLDNLIAVVDRNHFQANMKTESLAPLEPLADKFASFGWNVRSCNGHDFESMHNCFTDTSEGQSRPLAIIAETIRGKGLPSIEGRADRWFVNFTFDEVEQLLYELHGHESAKLESETLVVR